ncbi:hypothetical protein B1218_36830, partial [Pseudomonas ogarae]
MRGGGCGGAGSAGGWWQGVVGLWAGVVAGEKTGQGQDRDVGMSGCVFSRSAVAGAGYLACGG